MNHDSMGGHGADRPGDGARRHTFEPPGDIDFGFMTGRTFAIGASLTAPGAYTLSVDVTTSGASSIGLYVDAAIRGRCTERME